MKRHYIFGTGTPRSGGRLVSNIFSLSDQTFVFNEFIYFFRHIYKKYKNLNKENTLYYITGEICIRLKYRNNIIVNHKEFFSFLLSKKIDNYSDLYKLVTQYFLSYYKSNSDILIESTSGEWRNIKIFLNLNKQFKAYHYMRDPRAMLSSYKKITFLKNYGYFNCVFQWIDSYNSYIELKNKFSNKRYLFVKFEHMHNNPEMACKKILNFGKIKFNKKFLKVKYWKEKLNNKLFAANISSYDMKKKYGFSQSRIDRWKNFLQDWEIEVVNYLLKKQMKHLGYDIEETSNPKVLARGLKLIKKNNILANRLAYYLKTGKVKDPYINDPSKPENWGSNKNFLKRFIHEKEYLNYKNDMRNLNNVR